MHNETRPLPPTVKRRNATERLLDELDKLEAAENALAEAELEARRKRNRVIEHRGRVDRARAQCAELGVIEPSR